MSASYGLSSSYFGDVAFAPEMDDETMLDDRLEQARLNRTNYYRRMLASRNRPMDDYLVSKKSSYSGGSNHSAGSPARDTTSISDTSGTCSMAKFPEPHSSWRFYTSYDNGEWKRHAVPVDHDEEEILREPTKSLRRERDKVSPPVESSLRRMRQSGGPLLACMQPRPKRTSESSNEGNKVVSFQMVNGQPVNGLDAQIVGQLGPAELMNLYGNEDLVRQILATGQLVNFDGENPPQGNVKQEFSTKYMNTVTVTQPNGRHKGPGVVSGGEVGGGPSDAAKTEAEGSGVRKSRRPRIYGFQEKIIIPTKYKTMAETGDIDVQEKNTASGQSTSQVNQTGQGQSTSQVIQTGQGQSTSQVIQKERNDSVLPESTSADAGFTIVNVSTDWSKDADESSRGSPGRTVKASPVSQAVKVVVVNSGSDGEGDRKSEEHAEEKRESEPSSDVAQKEAGKAGTVVQSPFAMQEGLSPMENFKAFQENFRKQFENAGTDNRTVTEQENAASNPGQRLFSKDEQTFCEVGPDGSKRDGKVLQTYEVITSTSAEDTTHDKVLSVKEIPITPIEAVRSSTKIAAIAPAPERKNSNDNMEIFRENSVMQSPFGGHKTVQIVRETGSFAGGLPSKTVEIVRGSSERESPLTNRRTVEIVRETGGTNARASSIFPKAEERRTVGTVEDFRSSSLSPRTDDKKSTSIFDQTGSLFKQLSPRPRAEREKDSLSAVRDGRQWSRDQGQSPLGGGFNNRTSTRMWSHNDGLQRGATRSAVQPPPPSTRRKVVIVREMETSDDQPENVSSAFESVQNDGTGERSSRSQNTVEAFREAGAAAGQPLTNKRTVEIVREMGATASQPSSHSTVEIVPETSTATDNPRNSVGTVKSLWETDQEASGGTKSSIWGRTIFASTGNENRGSAVNDKEHQSSGGSTEIKSVLITGESQTKNSVQNATAPDLLDGQWEVQVAVKD